VEKSLPVRPSQKVPNPKAVILSVLLTPKETADLLRVKAETLALWRRTKRYPLKFIRLSKTRVVYRRTDVEAFLKAREVMS
jgi:hypothetical protein